MQGQLVTSSTALEGPQDKPGGRVVQDSALHKVTAGHPLR
jgi:hypothetical protein